MHAGRPVGSQRFPLARVDAYVSAKTMSTPINKEKNNLFDDDVGAGRSNAEKIGAYPESCFDVSRSNEK
ncbi:hypothetical protein NDU88_009764 [Pleurodeles waltl]|uniref:Uncharacterized protein n=1 Tax=Pleurodeles waltl TaxID=8319 RepID=A0AAV7PT14_PLEWA|nr:hypothetical protein NDU88_009764 [Pleurodeles waltl]